MTSAWARTAAVGAPFSSFWRSSSRWMVIALSGFLTSWATPAVSRPSAVTRLESWVISCRTSPPAGSARSCALTASKTPRRSCISASSRSSVTPSSPRPRRVKLLWMMWIGRSTAWARKIATSTDTNSSPIAAANAGVTVSSSERRTSSVEMPMRISPSASSSSNSGALHSSVRPREDQISFSCDSPFLASRSCRLPPTASRCPTCAGSLCATATPAASTMAA